MSFESDRRPTHRPSEATRSPRERPPPYADPWRETPAKEEPNESFQRLYDIFAHPRRTEP